MSSADKTTYNRLGGDTEPVRHAAEHVSSQSNHDLGEEKKHHTHSSLNV